MRILFLSAELAPLAQSGGLGDAVGGLAGALAARGHEVVCALPGYRMAQESASCPAREEAGAVLLAKLTLGALAYGDIWFGGKTRNPFNPSQGSSGSSAGSAAATAAGLVGFSLGTETLGSIVSPSTPASPSISTRRATRSSTQTGCTRTRSTGSGSPTSRPCASAALTRRKA